MATPSQGGPVTGARAASASREIDEVTKPDDERDLWSARASPRGFFGLWFRWLVAVIVILACAVWLRGNNTTWLGRWAVSIALVVAVVSALALLIRMELFILSKRYRLTTQRLFIEDGILVRTTNQTDLVRVNDVSVTQTLWGRIFDVGDVMIESPSDVSNPKIAIRGVLGPKGVAEHIHRQMQIIRNRKAVILEAT
jgi:uncharacterized membrane protein YdbT with pleckstrin-like domain